MGQLLLLLVVAVTVAAVVFGVTVLVTGRDPGLVPTEADGRAVPLPGDRPLRESDMGDVRFDTALRGYRMAQVDQAMRRAAYDIGYKTELIGVLEAEVAALREGRTAEADALRQAREQSAGPATPAEATDAGAGATPAGDTSTPAGAAPADDASTMPADPAGAEAAGEDGPAATGTLVAAGPTGGNGRAADADPTDAVRGVGEPVGTGAAEGEPGSPVVRSESA